MENDKSHQQIDAIKRQIDAELLANSTRNRRSTALMMTLGFAVLLLFAFIMYRQDIAITNRISSLESTLDKSSHLITVPAGKAPTTNESIQSDEFKKAVDARLQALETLQDAMVSTSKGALEQMNFAFSVVAIFFGLFSLFFAYRQIAGDASQELQDSEMRGLVGSFRENITVVNDLIASMHESFKHQEQMKNRMGELDASIADVKRFKERTVATQTEKVADLNEVAYSLFRDKIDRQSFKAEENRGLLSNFHMNMTALERTGDVSQFFSPICYVLRALHFFNVTQYELAAKDLEEARKIGIREIASPTTGWYGDSIESDAIKNLQQMLIDCNYHLGMIYYNLGEYAKSRERFQDVSKKNHLDFTARTYIPELMYFDTQIQFSKTIQEYESVQRELESLSSDEKRKIDYAGALAILMMKFGNCYLRKRIPLTHRRVYQSDEEPFRALTQYRAAMKALQESRLKGTLPDVFVRMSLAQGLEAVGREHWGSDSPAELFVSAFGDLRKIAATKTEPLVLALLSYSLAVCAKGGSLSQEDPRTYLARAREHLHRIPSCVLVFSPINKINLSHEQLMWEMDEFEKILP